MPTRPPALGATNGTTSNVAEKRRIPDGSLRFLASDTAVYGGAAAISKAAALITFPLLARSYSVAEYGIIDFFLVFGTLAALLLVFGQDSAVGRYFWLHEEEYDRRRLISQVFLCHIVTSIAVLVPVLALRETLGPRLLAVPDAGALLGVVLLQVPFLMLINFCRNLLKWTFARRGFLLLTLGATALQTCVLVIGVVIYDVSVFGVLAIYTVTNALVAAFGVYLIREWLVWPDGLTGFWAVIRYALPLGVVSVLGALTPFVERTLVSNLLELEDLGLLAAAAKTGMFLAMATSAFQTAWGPFYLSQHKQPGHPETFDRIFRMFTLGICIVVLIFAALVVPLLQFLASERYIPAYEVAVLIAVALAIQGIGWITEIGIHISLRSYFLPVGYALGLVCSLVVLWFLLPRIGLIAAGFGVVLANSAIALTLALIAQKTHPMPWSFRPVFMAVSAMVLIVILALAAGRWGGTLTFSAVTIFGLLAFVPVGMHWLLTNSERERFLSRVMAWR